MSRWIKNYQKYYGNIIKRINKSLKVQDVYQILPDSLVSELDRNCLCVFVRGFCPFISWMGCIYPMEAGVGREIKRERARGILGRYPTKHSSPPPLIHSLYPQPVIRADPLSSSQPELVQGIAVIYILSSTHQFTQYNLIIDFHSF